MKYKQLLATTVLGLSLAQPFTAVAEEFHFIRPGDPFRIFRQTDALVVELPANLSSDELNSLFLELDGVDITQMISLEGNRVIFTPATPYLAGGHTLRLVKMGKNNKLVEIKNWRFTTSGEPPKESPSSVSGNVNATYTNIPWKTKEPGREIPRNNLESQFDMNATTQTEGWQLSARGNGFINTNDSFNPSGDSVEVGEYLISAEKPSEDVSTLLRLGNHDIGANNILMNNFYRRGASAQFGIDNERAVVTAFSQDPAQAIGNDNPLGIAKSEQRVIGAHATVQPSESLGEALEFEGTVYEGEGSTYSAGSAGLLNSTGAGSAGQVGLTTVLFKDLLSFRSQYVKSKFDFDGERTGNSAENDDAQRYSFLLTPLGETNINEEGKLERLNVELAYQTTGTYYDTLLNPFLEKDRDTYSINSSYISGGLTIDNEVFYKTDNSNDLTTLPTNSSLGTWIQTSYAPEEEMFGRPVFFAGGAINDENREDTPAGFAGSYFDRTTASVNGGASMSFESTVLTLTHTYTQLSDRVEGNNDFNTHYTDLTLEFKAAESVTLRPGLQVEYLREGVDGVSHAYHASLGADIMFVQDKIWNNTNLSMLLNDGATTAEDDFNLQTEFTWQLKQSELNSPGYALALAGIYDNVPDPVTGLSTSEKDARVLLRFKIYGPYGF
jgi:hypothetical protein